MFNNVSQLLELRALRNRFEKNHPKFFPFMKAAKTRALEEGSLIEISVTPPDGENDEKALTFFNGMIQ